MGPLEKPLKVAVWLLGALASLAVVWTLSFILAAEGPDGAAWLPLLFFPVPFLLIALAAFAPQGDRWRVSPASSSSP